MKVAVIGAGIVGVTTAWELQADGHEVTVFERRGSVAAEASFANAGVVAPGYVTPWAAPGMPRKVLGQLFGRHAAVRLHPTLNLRTLDWLRRFRRACTAERYAAHRGELLALARDSRERLHEVARELKLDYERADGLLVLLRTPRDVALARTALKTLAELGVRFHLVDAARCREIEPGLNPETALQAGIHLPDDEVGNCRQFAVALRREAGERGVDFRFHTEVTALEPAGGGQRARLVQRPVDAGDARSRFADDEDRSSTPGPIAFDAIVVCSGVDSRRLLAPLGLKLPLLAVHGYSVTAPLRVFEAFPEAGPQGALMDERFKVAVSRIGQRIRVAGSAEIGGPRDAINARAVETLYKVLHDWFPGVARLDQAQVWKGARPMLPDGPPRIGASGVPGVFLNLGHGSSGWALACGSARRVADAVAGRR